MIKPDSLRDELCQRVSNLDANPDKLLVFIDNGHIRSTAATGMSFEYSYTLNVVLVDFTGDLDAVFIALLLWLRTHQPELTANLDTAKQAINFEADIIDNSTVDLSITVALTERVIVQKQSENTYRATHAAEPQLVEHLPAQSWELRSNTGELIGSWQSTAPTGADIETPHPPRKGLRFEL